MSRGIAGLALVVLALAAAGVARPAALAKSPCALVTAADARKALGGPVRPGKLQTVGLYRSCRYATSGASSVTVQVRPLTKADFARSAKANPGPVVRVAMPGATAYSVAGGAGLLVWKRGTEVTFLLLGPPKPLAAEKLLAKKALARL